MKRKALKKRRKTAATSIVAKATPTPASSPAATVPVSFPPPMFGAGPPPEVLYHEAEQDPDNRALGQYVDSIRLLREKSFSYREIAEWLSERGVEADHNAVYRVYMKSLPDYEAHLEEERIEEEAREEALRNQ